MTAKDGGSIDTIKALESIASGLEERLIFRSESGAFRNGGENRKQIIELLQKARSNFEKDPMKSREQLLDAESILADQIFERGLLWKAIHMWALIPLIIYGVAIILLLKYTHGLKFDPTDPLVLGVPIGYLAIAAAGGLARGLWWIIRKVQAKHLRPQFSIAYIVGPILSSLLGVLIYFVFKGGLLLLGEGSTEPNTTTLPIVMFLAGYSWEWVTDIVESTKSSFNNQSSPG